MQSPNFISDYLLFNAGNESHRDYHLWAALSLLASVSELRTFYQETEENGYEQLIYKTNFYACLVGPQGSRKSFAKDGARNIFTHLFPDAPVSYSVESREGICKVLASDECLRSYQTFEGVSTEYRPFVMYVNELKNFISIDPIRMVDFLVDIYDVKHYGVRTKNAGTDIIVNPCINILACATTEFIVDKLKDQILTGGLARRMVFINPESEPPRIAHPRVPAGGIDAMKRCLEHLRTLKKVAGRFVWENKEASDFYDNWYVKFVKPNDPLMAGFYRSKHIQIIKLMMLYGLADYKPNLKLLMTKDNFILAKATIEAIEPGMERLFFASGRNELSVPMQKLLDLVESNGGWMPEKELKTKIGKDLSPVEIFQVWNYLKDTDQLVVKQVEVKGVPRVLAMTKEFDRLNIKNGVLVPRP